MCLAGCVHAHLGNKIILQEQGSTRLVPKFYPVFDPKTNVAVPGRNRTLFHCVF